MNLIFVDVEASGPAPCVAKMTEFGAVHYKTRDTFRGYGDDVEVMQQFFDWLKEHAEKRPVFVSDNPAFDWQWINDAFWKANIPNPFGHSGRRISDFYAGLCNDFYRTQQWKRLRKTPHDHNPVNDAMGNVEAFERMLNGER